MASEEVEWEVAKREIVQIIPKSTVIHLKLGKITAPASHLSILQKALPRHFDGPVNI